jgi:EAL domain-containing protein (putative c-di-GMP-specific phosphodiesterase class I)
MATRTSLAPSVFDLIAERKLRTVFQPIVELDGRSPIGYEALTRGPAGSEMETPAALFGAAARDGVLPELDRACLRTAMRSAMDGGFSPSQLLFLNAEPAAIEVEALDEPSIQDGLKALPVVVEMTERALTSRPSEMLASVAVLRERNCRIALDDVGTDRRSLALMPFLAPDVIKLDMGLAQGTLPSEDAARVLTAIGAEAERSGAVVLAEGIENEEHLRRAEAMGATLGQGWLFGRPGPLPRDRIDHARPAVPRTSGQAWSLETPFERVARERPLRRADKRMLVGLSHHLEREAMTLSGEAVVVAVFQHAAFFTDDTRRRYEELAGSAALVCALGPGMAESPGTAIRGASLSEEDPLNGEWIVAVVGPHFAGALVAREVGEGGPDGRELFDYCVTYDRALVIEASDHVLRRVLRSG